MDSEGVSRIPGSYQTYEEAVWTRRGTWGSVVGGALVGLAVTLILGTVGLAAGLVGGGAMAQNEKERRQDGNRTGAAERPKAEVVGSQDPARGNGVSQETKDDAKKAAVGGGLWLILTAIVSGLLGGWVAGRVAQVFKSDVKLLGVLTWAVGVVLLYVLATLGSGALGAGLGAMSDKVADRSSGVDSDTGARAAITAGSVLWALVVGHLLGLLSSLLGAHIGMKRRIRLYPSGYVRDRQEGREFPRSGGPGVQPANP